MGSMNRMLILIVTIHVFAPAQDDLYMPESFYGGGVGFSRMFLFTKVGQLEGFELLGSVGDTAGLGLDTEEFTSPFVINGGEGFSNVTGRWRLGGYAGVGSSFISEKQSIILFLDADSSGDYEAGEERREYDPDPQTGNLAPDIQAKIMILMSGATVEYVFPLLRGLELSTGVLMGVGRLSLNITQSSGSPSWEEQFSGGYYLVNDVNGDTLVNQDDFDYVEANVFPTISTTRSMTSRTATFFNVQPYLAVKLQFLDRMGIRLSVGFNLAQVGQGTWKTDDRKPISDSPATNLNSLAVRTMIYFGL
ncbi:MAG: hypothetical protein V3U24_10050 [Candidatus Neomarinimicrobiota bacterium]